ncbi:MULTISPECIES: ferrochelatase [unclassified Gordonia (in: high G+C Gram-positive bacteria)]|uniref:ferrochelatase n=1 Tax=unclassified Gordonia (in: high G+C Gram-positive bacteria) TaxID=2657482 RepID=UPI001FFEC91D|nr:MULTISPECIES: ferrochelatase [unclassified Gordonia (in: high G+C Gram-positive bacteria)]UQE76873.1 ferrochelatase [Gordonia sp. PP30]
MTFTALLFLSFGGPDGPDDVRPFLENVTRGRGIPPERLDAVAEHYLHFGGVSPINRLNLDMIAALQAELRTRGVDLPIYFGNRNWTPYAADAVTQMWADGHRRALVFPTSAWGGYSGCRQYHEDIARALEEAGHDSGDMVLRKLPQYWSEPGFLAAGVSAVRRAQAEVSDGPPARLVFTAHSIPVSADAAAGVSGPGGGHLYSRQVAEASARVAAELGIDDYDVVWQSRSGPPQVPWLEPDICDHLEALAEQGVGRVIVFPIGFVSDHLEVVWDLDHEARELAAELGLEYVRADTVGTDPEFLSMVAGLIERYAGGGGDLEAFGCGDNGTVCRPGCCEPPRRRPAH